MIDEAYAYSGSNLQKQIYEHNIRGLSRYEEARRIFYEDKQDRRECPTEPCRNCGKPIPAMLANESFNCSCYRGNDFLGNNRIIDMTHTDPSVSHFHDHVQRFLNKIDFYTDINSNGESIEVRNSENRHVGYICGLSGSYTGTVELLPVAHKFEEIRRSIPFVMDMEREQQRINANRPT